MSKVKSPVKRLYEHYEATNNLNNWCCHYCGIKLLSPHDPACYDTENTRTRPTGDHVIPLRAGGSDKLDNLVPACFSCNAGKGTLSPKQKANWKLYKEEITRIDRELRLKYGVPLNARRYEE